MEASVSKVPLSLSSLLRTTTGWYYKYRRYDDYSVVSLLFHEKNINLEIS